MHEVSQYRSVRAIQTALADHKRQLITRRHFLLQAVGGSIALFFGPTFAAQHTSQDLFLVLDAVQAHLFPTEADIPGAHEIKALDYLRFVVSDPKVDRAERKLILTGVSWVESLSNKLENASFTDLKTTQRERVLRHMVSNYAGELWINTLLIYILEALLTAPAYGANPNGVGWKWLEHTPGYPLPGPETTYRSLKL